MTMDLPSSVNSSAVTVRMTSKPTSPRSFAELFRSNLQSLKEEATALVTFHPKEWLDAFRSNPKFPLFVLGDIDGFVALFMNNLATLLAVILGLKVVFKDELIYGKIVPG